MGDRAASSELVNLALEHSDLVAQSPQTSANGPSANVLVGPVIGLVSDHTARILLEVDADTTVVIVLDPTDALKPTRREELKFTREIPLAFNMTGLIPETEYSVSFENVKKPNECTGKLRTFPELMRDARVISGSCDNMAGRGDVDMWAKLNEEFVQKDLVDIVIHNGDQVYADPAFIQGEKFWKENDDMNEEAKIAQATQFYSAIYRETWNHPPTKAVLANCSNLMLWDDHELRNDWGAFPKDRDTDSMNYKLGLVARRAYWYYQRQLWDDLGDDITKKESETKIDGHLHTLPGGEIGICFMDTRGARSFYADNERPFLSKAQWNMFSNALDPQNGIFKNTRRLLLVHSMPVVLIGSGCSRKCGCMVGGDDKMGFGMFAQEQEDYLAMIDTWVNHKFDALDTNGDSEITQEEFLARIGSQGLDRFQRLDKNGDGKISQAEFEAELKVLSPRGIKGEEGQREVMLLGGDLHFSMKTTVCHAADKREVFTQIVTSALANKPPMCCAYYPMKWLASCFTSLGHGTYEYEHEDHNPINNFCTFNIDVSRKIEYEIVTAGPSPCCNKRGFCICFKGCGGYGR